VLLKLCRARDAETVRLLSAALGLPHAAVQRSLKRLESAGLYDAKRRRVNRVGAEEFLVSRGQVHVPKRDTAAALHLTC
jgi:predicted transcriptional regulator